MKILHINAGVRYYEDGTVNGTKDISFEEQKNGCIPRVPCVQILDKEPRWVINIDAESGTILNWTQGVKAFVQYKVCDDCDIEYSVDGEKICTNAGYWYCPDFLCPAGEGFGDYIIMHIDENGKIADWSYAEVESWAEGQRGK